MFELLARDARLDGHVEVLDVHAQDPVHAREVDADTSVQGCDVSLERRPGAEGDHRHVPAAAHVDDRHHLLGARGIDDDVRWRRPVPGLVDSVLAQDVGATGDARITHRRSELRVKIAEGGSGDGHDRIVPDRRPLRSPSVRQAGLLIG